MNITTEIYKTLLKLTVHLKIFAADDKNDKNFQRQYFSVSTDVEKLVNSNYGSFVIRSVLENLRSSIDFEPKFPLKPVR